MIYTYGQILVLLLPQIHVGEVRSTAFQIMLDTLLSHSVPEISVHEVKKDNKVVWLDARQKQEYQVSKIEDARWVGYDNFSMDSVEDIPKNAKIIVYCSVGYRSEKVSEKLILAGYTHVSNLFGGIFEWKNQGKTVVDRANMETDKVHGFGRIWGIWLTKGEAIY